MLAVKLESRLARVKSMFCYRSNQNTLIFNFLAKYIPEERLALDAQRGTIVISRTFFVLDKVALKLVYLLICSGFPLPIVIQSLLYITS